MCSEHTTHTGCAYLGCSYRRIVGEVARTQRQCVQCGVHPRRTWIGERQFGQDAQVLGRFPFGEWTGPSTKLSHWSKTRHDEWKEGWWCQQFVHDEFYWPQGKFCSFPPGVRLTDCLAQDYVLSVAVSHDGQWVVSGSKDRGVQFWDAKTAIVQLMLQGHKNSGPLSPVDPTPRSLVDSLPFQSSQLTSALLVTCWRPVQAIGRLASVSLIFSEIISVFDCGPFRELLYRPLIAARLRV